MKFYKTDKGTTGCSFGGILGYDSDGSVRVKISPHVSYDTSTGKYSRNTDWNRGDVNRHIRRILGEDKSVW